MRTRDTLLVGALASAGLLYGARQWIRSRRRIELDDRVVLITGASSGLGFLVARQAAKRGARLVIAARDSENLEDAARELSQIGRGDVLAVPTDVNDPAQCRELVRRAIDRHARIDILVNNAGIIQVGPLEAMTPADFQQVLGTHLWGPLHCILEVLPHMRARGFGRIANVVSVGGKVAIPHLVPYTVSKFALAGLTKGLRAELAQHNILVTGVYPGTIRTGGHTNALFKGNRNAEYAWFALGDTIPGLATSAEGTAQALWNAVRNGDPEANPGWQPRLLPLLDALSPNWSGEVTALINRLLPAAIGLGESALRGEELRGTVAEALTRLVPPQTRPAGNGSHG